MNHRRFFPTSSIKAVPGVIALESNRLLSSTSSPLALAVGGYLQRVVRFRKERRYSRYLRTEIKYISFLKINCKKIAASGKA